MREIEFRQTGYVVTQRDCVATALGEIEQGMVVLRGEGAKEISSIPVLQSIPYGHKFAIKDIAKGEPIVKYAAVIATATQNIKAGEHVHLHNCRSNFDLRAATFDQETADSTDMEYRLY